METSRDERHLSYARKYAGAVVENVYVGGGTDNQRGITLNSQSNVFSQNTTQYIVNNTHLATHFSSNEPSSDHYLTYGRGAFSKCVQYGISNCLQQLLIKNSSFKNLLNDIE